MTLPSKTTINCMGLTWFFCNKKLTWAEALEYAANNNARLPTAEELREFLHRTKFILGMFWSSTSWRDRPNGAIGFYKMEGKEDATVTEEYYWIKTAENNVILIDKGNED